MEPVESRVFQQARMTWRVIEVMKTWDTLLNGSEGDKPKELWSCRGRQQAWPGMLLESIPVRYLLCGGRQHEMVLIFTIVHSPFVTAERGEHERDSRNRCAQTHSDGGDRRRR